jgi:small subunit ribosomal protein S19e
MAEEKKVGCTVKDVPAQPFIAALAQHFKKSGKIELPEWHDLIKTSIAKELPPRDPDWYYVRAASLARKVYLRGGTGVGAFTKVKGGANKDGVTPAHFRKAAKGNIRHMLQQLANADIISLRKDKKGRWITKNGQRELDTIAGQLHLQTQALKAAQQDEDDGKDEEEEEAE